MTKKWIVSQDEIETFLPKGKPRMVILGTMGAICARTLDGEREEEIFFYHNNRNHFWRVLQRMFEPENEPRKMSVSEKKYFLHKWGVAMTNLVQDFTVDSAKAHDPSDPLLFKAQKRGQLHFKTASSELRQVLKTTPLFFTCKFKKGIQNLVEGYLDHNQLPISLVHQISYLPTPTRCNPLERSQVWRAEVGHKTSLTIK